MIDIIGGISYKTGEDYQWVHDSKYTTLASKEDGYILEDSTRMRSNSFLYLPKGSIITYTKSNAGNHVFGFIVDENFNYIKSIDWTYKITLDEDSYIGINLLTNENLDKINLSFQIPIKSEISKINDANMIMQNNISNKVDKDGVGQILPINTTFIETVKSKNLYKASKLQYECENLFNIVVDNDGKHTINRYNDLVSKKTVVLSVIIPDKTGTYTATISNCNIPLYDKTQIGFIGINEVDHYTSQNKTYIWIQNTGNSKSFELEAGITYYVYLDTQYITAFNQLTSGYFYFQVEEGDIATQYEIPNEKYKLKNSLYDNDELLELKSNISMILNSNYTSPLKRISGDYNLSACFKSIACIGDSLTQGTYDRTNGALFEADAVDYYNFPMNIHRITGAEVYNLGRAGATALDSQYAIDHKESWHYWADINGYWNIINTNKPVAYIIALGTNDIGYHSEFSGDPDENIDINDLNNTNRSTSVGGYAHIIQYIYTIQPQAKIFCVGLPATRQGKSQAGINMNAKLFRICELLNCYFLDLANEWITDTVEISSFNKNYKNGGHLNALGYNVFARVLCTYIDYIIRTNINDFQNVQFIGTNMDYQDN